MKIGVLVMLVVFFKTTVGQDFQWIKNELLGIHEDNMELRMNVMPIVKKYGFNSPQMDSINQLIHEFDSVSLVKVTGIIINYGWLGKSQIGEIPNSTLFLVIQHAQDETIREKYFPLLKKSAENGESSLADMATMQDRILVEEGKHQIYGTQSKMVDGEMQPFPISNPDSVKYRRKQVGLPVLK